MSTRDSVSTFKNVWSHCKHFLSSNIFLLCTVTGVAIGVGAGFGIRPLNPSKDVILLISYPGELFLRLLKLLVLPFILACLIMGTATLNVRKYGKIALRTIAYFFITSLLNVCLGVALAVLIKPGNPGVKNTSMNKTNDSAPVRPLDSFLDMGRNLIPDNAIRATFQQTVTFKDEQGNSNLQYKDGSNMLGLMLCSVVFGSVLGTLGNHRLVVVAFFNVIYEVVLKILLCAIWLTPIGVASIICEKVITVPNLTRTVQDLGWFVLTVFLGVALYQFIILQLIYLIITRKNPYAYYLNFVPAIVVAFAAASKTAAMPLTIKIMDEKVKIDKRISRFLLPVGCLNMDGTGLFIAIALVFIAQLNSISLGGSDYVAIIIGCTFLSFSSATVPSAALVLVLILTGIINAPKEDVSLLFAVDWLVDRLRTTNNLLGDVYACAAIQSMSKKQLSEDTNQFSEDDPLINSFIAEHTTGHKESTTKPPGTK